MESVEEDVNIEQCKVKDLLPTLFRLQSQRCVTYQRLHDAQMMFFNTKNFPAFQNFLSDITVIFGRISQEILAIKKRLENQRLVFKHIEQLQDYEQQKLQITNDLFLATVEKKAEQVEGLTEKLNQLIDNINEVLEELRYDQEEFAEVD